MVLGEYKEIQLNVSVDNLQESAYEAELHITHSPALSYIATVKVKLVHIVVIAQCDFEKLHLRVLHFIIDPRAHYHRKTCMHRSLPVSSHVHL